MKETAALGTNKSILKARIINALLAALVLLIIGALLSSCSGNKNAQDVKAGTNGSYFPGTEEKKLKEIRVTGDETTWTPDATATPIETTMAVGVITEYLNAVMLGGTEQNWMLSSERFRDEVLSEYSEEETTMDAFVKFLNEGIAHEKIVTFTIAQSVIRPDRGTAMVSLTRKKLDNEEYFEIKNFRLVREETGWKVDGGF